MALGSPVLAARHNARSGSRAAKAASTRGRRSAVQAELSELEEEEAVAELLEEEAATPAAERVRRSQRQGAGQRLQFLLQNEEHSDSEIQAAGTAAAARTLPLRSTTISSPAGERRGRKAQRLELLAAAAATTVEEATAEGEDEEAEGEATEPSQQDGQATAAAAIAELAPHHRETRAATLRAQDRRAQRVQSVRRSGGVPKNFQVGDVVLLRPPKRGRAGNAPGPKRIICRVVGHQRFGSGGSGGMTKFKLRCNAGLLNGYHFAAALDQAPAASAAKLTFTDSETAGVQPCSLDVAWAAEAGAVVAVRCRCKNKCGSSCACSKAGRRCSRNCTCPACRGKNCGNNK